VEGKQVIFPEKSSAWYELLRLEWAKEGSERPRFVEEMSREKGEAPLAPQDTGNKLPERLETLLNGPSPDPKTGAIRLLRAPFESLLTPLRLRARDIGVVEGTVALTGDMMRRIVQQTGGRVFQIDLRADPPTFMAKKPFRTVYEALSIPVFVVTEEGPGLLVLNPAAPELLKKEDMPAGLLKIMEKAFTETTGIFVEKPKPQANPAPSIAGLRAKKALPAVQVPLPELMELQEGTNVSDSSQIAPPVSQPSLRAPAPAASP